MDHSAIVREYKPLRALSILLNNQLAETLSGDEVAAAARDLGMLRGKEIDLETEDEIGVLMDYAIHDLRREGGRNAVDRLLRDNPPPDGSDQLRLLRSLQQSRYTIVDVETPIPGVGVRGVEGPQRTPILLVDIGLSRTARPGAVLATRIHSPGDGWWITTGAALPLGANSVEQMVDAMEDYKRRHGVEPSDRVRTAMIIRACVSCGASRHVRYASPGERLESSAASPPIRASARVGRNDPCPCGSGRKYKKCCGA